MSPMSPKLPTLSTAKPPRRWAVLLLIVLVSAVSAAYLATGFAVAGGRPVAPLDDSYILYQYARQIARGYPYQYNDGDPPTTGMTSQLFGFLLAGIYLLGFSGERMVAFAVGTGVIWLGGIAWLTYRLTSHLMRGEESAWGWPMAAAGLVVLTGSVQWACFNGMETGLFTLFALAAMDAFLLRRTGLCAVWLSLAELVRPEGVVLAGVMWTVTLVEGGLRYRTVLWRQLAILSAALLVGFVPSVVNWALTGTTMASGLRAKSWWLNVPFYGGEIVRSIARSYRRIVLGLFLGWDSPTRWYVPPGLLLFSGLGWVALGQRRCWSALAATLLWFVGGTLSTATLITALWHLGRYQIPFVPPMIALAVCGLAFLHFRMARMARRWQRALPGLGLLFLLTAAVYSTPRFVDLYRRAIGTVVGQQLTLADWLREHLPHDARVGVHDTGSLRYLGERPTYDLIGLTTAGATTPWRHGAGSVFERMEHSPMRPDYFAIYPDAFSIPYLAATDLFAVELFRVEVPDAVVASAGPVQGVWRADWRLAGSGERYYQPDVLARTVGLTPVDTLDVADLEDEEAHAVTWWQDVRRPGFPTEVWQLTYRVLPEREVLDGGRLLTGGLSCEVETEPGEPLWIVARLHAQEGGAVLVEVDGWDVGRWAFPPVPSQWLETVFRVPAEAVTRPRTRVVLRVDADERDFLHYAPYYLWFLQGEPEGVAVEIERRVEAVFDLPSSPAALTLVGFDLPQRAWRPGDVVPVTLYWRSEAPDQSDAKVFLHLYDSAGHLGPQSDGWAFYGTRPPYTWWAGEVVPDPRQIALPVDLPVGTYSLEAGLYHPDGSGRLPAYLNGIRQPEERVLLATIEVTE